MLLDCQQSQDELGTNVFFFIEYYRDISKELNTKLNRIPNYTCTESKCDSRVIQAQKIVLGSGYYSFLHVKCKHLNTVTALIWKTTLERYLSQKSKTHP